MIELWGEAVRSIEPLVKPAHRDQWLRPIECLGIIEGRIRLRAPNRYHKEWFEDNYLPSSLQDLESRAQQRFAVDFESNDSLPATVTIPTVVAANEASSGGLATSRTSVAALATPPALPAPTPPRALDSRYTFD